MWWKNTDLSPNCYNTEIICGQCKKCTECRKIGNVLWTLLRKSTYIQPQCDETLSKTAWELLWSHTKMLFEAFFCRMSNSELCLFKSSPSLCNVSWPWTCDPTASSWDVGTVPPGCSVEPCGPGVSWGGGGVTPVWVPAPQASFPASPSPLSHPSCSHSHLSPVTLAHHTFWAHWPLSHASVSWAVMSALTSRMSHSLASLFLLSLASCPSVLLILSESPLGFPGVLYCSLHAWL